MGSQKDIDAINKQLDALDKESTAKLKEIEVLQGAVGANAEKANALRLEIDLIYAEMADRKK